MFRTRLISGIVLVVLAILLVTKGGVLLYCVTAAISLIGMFELYRVMGIEKKAPGIAGYLACLGYYGLVWFEGQHYVTLLAIAALMVLMSIYVFTFPKYGTEQITVAFFGIFYLGIMLSYLYQVRAMADGKYLVWLIFLSSWGCDTCAYCAGNAPWKTPSGTGFKSEKIDRGRRRRCGRIGSVRLHLCVFLRCEDGRGQQSDGGMRGGVCDCGGYFPDRGSGGVGDQAEPQCQGLRKPDSGTRRRAGSVRQHDFYGTGDLFCTDVFTIKRKHV